MCSFKMFPSQSPPESSGSHVRCSRLLVIATHSIRLEHGCGLSAAGHVLPVASARRDWTPGWTVAHTLHIECSHAWLSVCSFQAFGMLTLRLLKPQQGVFILALGNFWTAGTLCSLVRGLCMRTAGLTSMSGCGEARKPSYPTFLLGCQVIHSTVSTK